jgi:hypothetical protein
MSISISSILNSDRFHIYYFELAAELIQFDLKSARMSNNEELHDECQHEHVFERLAKRYVQPGNDGYVGAADGEYCIDDLRYFGSLKNSRHVITHFFCGLITVGFGLVVVIKQTFRYFLLTG